MIEANAAHLFAPRCDDGTMERFQLDASDGTDETEDCRLVSVQGGRPNGGDRASGGEVVGQRDDSRCARCVLRSEVGESSGETLGLAGHPQVARAAGGFALIGGVEIHPLRPPAVREAKIEEGGLCAVAVDTRRDFTFPKTEIRFCAGRVRFGGFFSQIWEDGDLVQLRLLDKNWTRF